MTAAVAYLRRSRVDTSRPGTISHEQQLAAVRRLAEQHGDDPDALVVLEDWGRSGRGDRQHLRTAFARLEAMVAAGETSAIYAYSLSRLGRSLETVTRLAEACGKAGIPIRCADGFSPDVASATGQLVTNILAAVHQWQAAWTAERAAEASNVRRARGDHMGPAPYGFAVVGGQLVRNAAEDLGLVVDAFREAGTYQGAARLLTARGVRPRRGSQRWAATAIRDMLHRQAPDVVPPMVRRGRPPARAFRFVGLLRCPCGATLTGRTVKGRWVTYECKRAGLDPAHPRPASVSEATIRPWLEAEAARLRVPALVEGDDDQARRDELEARRRRILDNYEDGLIKKPERDAKLGAIADELADLGARQLVQSVPQAVDWTWPPERLSTVLRKLWHRVELDERLRPVEALWTMPEWRADDATLASERATA